MGAGLESCEYKRVHKASQAQMRTTYELREAAKKVNGKTRRKDRIPAGVGAYFFGHARISELLQVHGVDPLTVAAQTGTSLAMIKKLPAVYSYWTGWRLYR